MKQKIATLSLILSVSASGVALAQSDNMDMKGMDMSGMEMHDKTAKSEAIGVVKQVDRNNGTVTLAHGPVKSLGWPAMTMSFAVEDKMLFDKLVPGRKVRFEFVKKADRYVVTNVE